MTKADSVHSTPRRTAPKTQQSDPAFGMIQRHRELSDAYDKAVNHPDVGNSGRQFAKVNTISTRAGTALVDHADQLFKVGATTVAGVVASLRYISTLKDWEMPRGISEEAEIEALKKLCRATADSLEAIEKRRE